MWQRSSALLLLALPWPALAYDELADDQSPPNFTLAARDLSLTLKGELELELHDLEGRGGPGFDSASDTRTIGTRSPFAEIDSFWLAPRVRLSPAWVMNTSLELTSRGSRVGGAWLEARAAWLFEHRLELGYQTPFIAVDRRSERYPLAGTIYWREPEMHALYEARYRSDWLALEGGVSMAAMRPLTFAGVQESTSQRGTINVLAYGAGRVYSGVEPVWSVRLRAAAGGAFAEIFGWRGRLANEGGIDELRSGFAGYQDLPGYNAGTPLRQRRRVVMQGGRLGFIAHGVYAWLEAEASREGLIERRGGYGQVSYVQLLELWGVDAVEPLARYESYRILGATEVQASGRALRSPALSQAVAWDWRILTLGLTAHVGLLKLRLEYYWIDEQNGVPALGIPEAPFANDELLAQVEVRF